MKKKVVSIFSGIDALGLGFRKEFDIVLAVEKEKHACDILEHNKERFHPHMTVLNKSIDDIPEDVILEYKGVDGLIGGPPCQAFSTAKGCFNLDDNRIKYLFEYAKWVRIIKPSFFVLENVKGLINKSAIAIFDEFINKVEKLGYSIKYELLNAHDYGNAQSRERVIVVGFKKELDIEYVFPQPVENKKFVKDILDDPNNIGEVQSLSPRLKELMPYIPEGGYWRDLPTEELLKKALGVNYKKRSGGMTGVCRRLHKDRPCPTVVASGPSQNTTLLVHPTENRALSVTEYKRAQGIPEDYEIFGSKKTQYEVIGNAVPVELASSISKSIYEAIFRYEYTNKETIDTNHEDNIMNVQNNIDIVSDNEQFRFDF